MAYGTILVVEDDENLLAGIRDILTLENYDIHTAQDGQEGLDKLKAMSPPPDLIVSDIMMPVMDGIDFLKAVHTYDEYVSIPFIFLTAKGEKSDIQKAKKLGVDDYVVKPFNASDLLIAIQSRLDRSRIINKVHTGRQDELKNNILTILNHEFRTPLTFVVAYSDMLGDFTSPDDTHESSNEDMLSFLSGVRSGADRLRRLIENFIMVVEFETGSAYKTFEWRKHPIKDIHTILQNAVNEAMAAQDQAYRCNLIVADDIPEFVGDEDYLKAAIIQLLDNACKFSETAFEINVSAFVADHHLVIEVEDRGRGIPPEEQEKVWQIFYQINRPLYEDQGAGSGLPIVKNITEMHGGVVKLRSEPGIGSVFSMCIPLETTKKAVNGKHV